MGLCCQLQQQEAAVGTVAEGGWGLCSWELESSARMGVVIL